MKQQQLTALSTRSVNLRLWARLVREHDNYIRLYSNLEYFTYNELKQMVIYAEHNTAFGLAVRSELFGLQNPCPLGDIMQRFELTQKQLHEFSCDCGGHLTNDEMAKRIEKLA